MTDIELIVSAEKALSQACGLLMGPNLQPGPGNQVHMALLNTLVKLGNRIDGKKNTDPVACGLRGKK